MSKPEQPAVDDLADAEAMLGALLGVVRALDSEGSSLPDEHRPAWRDMAWHLREESSRACRRVAGHLRRSASHLVSGHASDLAPWVAGASMGGEDRASMVHEAGAAYAVGDEPATAEYQRLLRRLERLAETAPGAPEIDDMVAILEAMADLAPRRSPSPPSSGLSAAEVRTLQEIGIDVDARPSGDAAWTTQEAYARLLMHALPVDRAAQLLGVDASRVYQRLKARTLYGIRLGGRWKLPAFQFTDAGEVPGIGRVLQALPEDLHPLSVSGWFSTPKDTLQLSDDAEPLNPREWLLSGGDPTVAEELAAAEAVGL